MAANFVLRNILGYTNLIHKHYTGKPPPQRVNPTCIVFY